MKKVLKLINDERNSLTIKSPKAQGIECEYIDNAICTVNATDNCAKYDYVGCFGFAIDFCESEERDTVACGPTNNDTY